MGNIILFYETLTGNCPVEDFLKGLPVKHHAKTVRNLKLLGSHLGRGLIDHIDGDIWELRTRFGNDISRILYFTFNCNKIVLLHGFVKKTNKIPPREIKTAFTRMEDFIKR